MTRKTAKTKMYAERREQRALTPDDVRDRHRECEVIELSRRDLIVQEIIRRTGAEPDEAMRLARNGYSLCPATV
jgi:hypothetical protein